MEAALGKLADSKVVGVTAGEGDKYVKTLNAGLVQNIVLAGVAAVDGDFMERGEALAVVLVLIDDDKLVLLLLQVLDEEVRLVMTSGDADSHSSSSSSSSSPFPNMDSSKAVMESLNGKMHWMLKSLMILAVAVSLKRT